MKVKIFSFATFLFLLSCQSIQYPNFQQTATTTKGIVSSGQPLATLAGKIMLEKGGNAVDAAVATAFALSVVEPSMSGLGGRLQAIIRLPNGEIHGIDATTQAPMNYDTSTTPIRRFGYETIGIPGVVAGLTKLLEDHGTLPLHIVMQPAIKYARKGFPIMKGEAKRHSSAIEQLRQYTGSQQYFMNGDTTYLTNEIWIQKDLSNTLKQIAIGGKDAFYKGKIAEQIVADFKANGGLLTMEDLANYEARASKIVQGTYRGYDLHGLWLPSFGAITIEIMHILENLPMHNLKGADWLSAVGQAIDLAYQDRWRQLNGFTVADTILNKAYAKSLAAQIDINKPLNKTGYYQNESPESWTASMGHTTHLSTSDESGMMVGLTQSLGPNMGSKVASSGLGFLYAVSLGSYLGIYEAGQRVNSHISPFIITKDGKPFLVLGAAGGSRIVTAIAAVCSRIIDHNMTIGEALAAPRVYSDDGKLLLETHQGTGWEESYMNELKKEGFKLDLITTPARFGRVHAIHYDAKRNVWIGAADPDWEGATAGEK